MQRLGGAHTRSTLLLAALACAALVGCSSDRDALIGSWKYESKKEGGSSSRTLTLLESGRFVLKFTGSGTCAVGNWTTSTTGAWEVQDATLVLVTDRKQSASSVDREGIVSVDEKQLKLDTSFVLAGECERKMGERLFRKL